MHFAEVLWTISTCITGKTPIKPSGVCGSITIAPQKPDVRPRMGRCCHLPQIKDIDPTDFERRNGAILEGEKAALAALPQILIKLSQMRHASAAAQAARRNPAPAFPEKCEAPSFFTGLFGKDAECGPKGRR